MHRVKGIPRSLSSDVTTHTGRTYSSTCVAHCATLPGHSGATSAGAGAATSCTCTSSAPWAGLGPRVPRGRGRYPGSKRVHGHELVQGGAGDLQVKGDLVQRLQQLDQGGHSVRLTDQGGRVVVGGNGLGRGLGQQNLQGEVQAVLVEELADPGPALQKHA